MRIKRDQNALKITVTDQEFSDLVRIETEKLIKVIAIQRKKITELENIGSTKYAEGYIHGFNEGKREAEGFNDDLGDFKD